jgi:hypothetical protein
MNLNLGGMDGRLLPKKWLSKSWLSFGDNGMANFVVNVKSKVHMPEVDKVTGSAA